MPSNVLVIRAISLPAWSSTRKFHARQFSALIAAVGVAARLQAEVDLADHVLLHDAADLVVGAVADDDRALHHLGRPGDPQQDLTGHVGDLELVGHELVEVADEAQHLLRLALTDLVDGRDLLTVAELKTPYCLFSSISLAFWFTTRIGSSKMLPLPWNAASPTFALRYLPSPLQLLLDLARRHPRCRRSSHDRGGRAHAARADRVP